MRAARLLNMLLILQRRGRMTADQLAGTLEVSRRTVLRDVEALSEAGVPVYTTRGAAGGIQLLDGFQTHLTGLSTDEALCLYLVGQPQLAHRLGLAAPSRSARDKLLSALSPAAADQAEQLTGWLLHDPDPWVPTGIPHGELRRLLHSIRQRRQIELAFADAPPATVQPLGLVLKAGSWHLVVVDAAVTVIGIDTLRATRLTSRRFHPPAGFDLAEFWARWAPVEARAR
jgi:predicted DNA-binding transcriptional regulator YafY